MKGKDGFLVFKSGKLAPHCLCDFFVFLNQLFNVFPRIMKLLPGPHQIIFSNREKLRMFIARVIENHRRDWNPAEARDFIDAYLQEIEKVRKPELFPEF